MIIKDLENDAESEIVDFAKEFTSTYFAFLYVAEKYSKIAETLLAEISEVIRDSFTPNSAEWDKAHVRSVQYESGKLRYIWL